MAGSHQPENRASRQRGPGTVEFRHVSMRLDAPCQPRKLRGTPRGSVSSQLARGFVQVGGEAQHAPLGPCSTEKNAKTQPASGSFGLSKPEINASRARLPTWTGSASKCVAAGLSLGAVLGFPLADSPRRWKNRRKKKRHCKSWSPLPGRRFAQFRTHRLDMSTYQPLHKEKTVHAGASKPKTSNHEAMRMIWPWVNTNGTTLG